MTSTRAESDTDSEADADPDVDVEPTWPPAVGPVVTVAACQVELAVGYPERNAELVDTAIRSAAARGARLVVVPELANSGYVFDTIDEARASAERIDGPTVRRWAALAAELDLVLVGGLCEDDGAVLRNSSVVLDPTGVRAVYRKAHLWGDEPNWFEPGSERPPVVDTALGRVGTVVCYDLEFPEWVRLPGLDGADILAAPTNWPADGARARPTPMEVVRVQAAASVNRMVVVAADRCGPERGVTWTGGSAVVSADGHLLAGPPQASEPAVLVADVDLGATRDKRTGPRNHPHRDRRTELYG
jgi:5-aminopentanamidase